MSVGERQLQAEWMDDPAIDVPRHIEALAGLRRINLFSRTTACVWQNLCDVAQQRQLRRLRVLDVACGGGDLVRGLAQRAKRSGREFVFAGCDLSPTAIEHAASLAVAERLSNCTFFVHDAIDRSLPDEHDVILSTLFLHHLQRNQAVKLLRQMSTAARHAVLVDDLIRSTAGYWLAYIGCRVLSRSPIVHFDGPVSVQGAFTMREARELADEAGLDGARISKHWPERFTIEWQRTR